MPITTRNGRAKLAPTIRAKTSSLARHSVVAALALLVATTGANSRDKKQDAAPADPFQEMLEAAPFAELQLSSTSISLPFASTGARTLPGSVDFVVIGNARATLTATPAKLVKVNGRVLGRAENGAEAIGFDIALQFERFKYTRNLPDYLSAPLDGGPSVSSTTGLIDSGLERAGTLTVITDPTWTLTGGIPLPGNYVGEIILTLTADY